MAQPRRVNLDEQAKPLSCTTAILADGSVTAIKLAAGAVSGASIADGSITTIKLDIDADLNFNNFQAVNFRLENLPADPPAGNAGRLIWRTDLMEIHVDNGTAFIPLAEGTGGANTSLSNLTSTAINNHLVPANNDIVSLGNINHVWDTLFVRQIISDTGVVTIPGSLTVAGFTLTSSPVAGYVMTSDTNGNATWQASIAGNSQFAKDFVTVATPVADHIITLSHTPTANSEIVVWQGIVLTSHAGKDYTISGNVVTISGTIVLTVGDELQVTYAY